jgi:hypothetical protein
VARGTGRGEKLRCFEIVDKGVYIYACIASVFLEWVALKVCTMFWLVVHIPV